MNLHGAINAETLDVTVIESKTVDAESTISLLETLNQKYPLSSRLHIILGNARYHYSRDVRDWIEENGRINLAFLPVYSPELNLIERLWNFFKQNVLYNKYHENLKAFRDVIIEFFQRIGQREAELATLLGGGFLINPHKPSSQTLWVYSGDNRY